MGASIDTADLLGRKWEVGVSDCWEIMREVLSRAGRAVPASIPCDHEGLDGKGLRGLRCACAVAAVRVGEWPAALPLLELGDVLAIDNEGKGRVHGVATVVSLSPLRVLHTTRGAACHRYDPRNLSGVVAVYRFPRAEARVA